MQQWRAHMQSFHQQGKDSIMVFDLFLLLIRNELIKSLWIIMDMHNVDSQKVFQELPHTMDNVDFPERQWYAAMKTYWGPSNRKILITWTNSCHLTHVCCLPAFTDEKYGETSWQELNRGKCKSDTPCLVQRLWFKEWLWTKSLSNIYSWQE